MKSTKVLAFILATAFLSAPAGAQTNKAEPKPIAPTVVAPSKSGQLVIAVVDFATLSRDSSTMKAVRAEAEKLNRRFEAERVGEEKSLRADIDKLEKQRPVLSLREFEKRRNAMQQRIANLQRTVQLRRQQLTLAFRISAANFREEVIKVVQAMAVEKGYSIVIDKGTVIHVSPTLEVTGTALERVNKQVPKISFEFPPKRPVRPAPTSPVPPKK